MPQSCRFLDQLSVEHNLLLEQVQRLEKLLKHIRYEGKGCLPENLSETEKVISFFEREVSIHVRAENECLFPFVETHIPRLAPIVQLFRREHEDFKKNLDVFRKTLNTFYTSNHTDHERTEALDNMRDVGTYLVYLLRAHLRAETDHVYHVISKELKCGEKNELSRLLASFETGMRKRSL